MEKKVFCFWILSSMCTKVCTLRIRRLVIYLGLLYLCLPAFALGESRRRSRRAIQYDDTCSTDCSQTNPRFFGDTTVFNCTIGNLSEVKKFRENYKRKMEKAEIRFDPPNLLSIDFYHKHFKDGTSEGALNITFELPKGKLDGYLHDQEVEYPIAVFLHFQSVEEPKFQDAYYYKNPRERIFQFWNHKPKILYDIMNPRNISYDCLVGLDDSKPATAYTINLATAFGLNITYNCTVYAQQGRDIGYTIKWLPAMATYLNLSARSVHVVFEEYKLEVTPELLVYYNVCLVFNDDETIIDHKKIYPGTHSTMFTDLKHGKYYVKVSKCEDNAYDLMYDDNADSPRCISATSYVIDATGIPAEGSPEILSNLEGSTLFMALALSLCCLTVVTILMVLRRKYAGGKKPTGWTQRAEPCDPCRVTDSTERKKDYGPATSMEKQSLVFHPNAEPRKVRSDKPSEPYLMKLEQDRQYVDPNSSMILIKSSELQSATLMENNQNTQSNAIIPDRPVEAQILSSETNKEDHSFSEICDGSRSSSRLKSFRSYMDIFAKINDSNSTIDTHSSKSDGQTDPKRSIKSFRSYMAIFARINDSISSADTFSFASDKSNEISDSNYNFEKEISKRRLSLPAPLDLNYDTHCNTRYIRPNTYSGIEHEEADSDNVADHSSNFRRNVLRCAHTTNRDDGKLDSRIYQDSQMTETHLCTHHRSLNYSHFHQSQNHS